MRQKPGREDAAMLLTCLIWGANFAVSKMAFAHLSPLAFTALRFAAGTVLLFVAVRAVEGSIAVPRGALLWRLVWLGVFGNTLYQLGYVTGLARSTATNTALILSSSPATVAIIGGALGIERTTVRVRLGIALGIAGVAVVILARTGGALHLAGGDVFTVGALLCWSIYTVGLRNIEGISALQVTAWTTLTGTPGIVLMAIPELSRTNWQAVTAGAWGSLAYAVVLSLIVGYVLWNRSVRAVGATRTAIYMCVTPLFALLVAWALLGERPTPLHALGGALVVAGVLLTRVPPKEAALRRSA